MCSLGETLLPRIQQDLFFLEDGQLAVVPDLPHRYDHVPGQLHNTRSWGSETHHTDTGNASYCFVMCVSVCVYITMCVCVLMCVQWVCVYPDPCTAGVCVS